MKIRKQRHLKLEEEFKIPSESIEIMERRARMTLNDILESKPSGGVITVSQETPAAEAIRIMTDKNISAVIVVDKNDTLTGMFTERDVVHCVEKNIALDKVPVKDVMGRDIITFEPSTEISAAISVIARKKVRHIPVVEGGKIMGIVTYRDLVSYVLPELIYMAEDM